MAARHPVISGLLVKTRHDSVMQNFFDHAASRK
jgi:hypothetical protein